MMKVFAKNVRALVTLDAMDCGQLRNEYRIKHFVPGNTFSGIVLQQYEGLSEIVSTLNGKLFTLTVYDYQLRHDYAELFQGE